jgi:uncharacterized protein with GYD domain
MQPTDVGFKTVEKTHLSASDIMSSTPWNDMSQQKQQQYVILWSWTDQGIRNVKDTIKRAEAFKAEIQKAGGKANGFYYTSGQYDGIVIAEAPSDDVIMSCLLSLESKVNVRTTTLKAFSESETAKVIERLF